MVTLLLGRTEPISALSAEPLSVPPGNLIIASIIGLLSIIAPTSPARTLSPPFRWESLWPVEITSVAKRPQALADAAAVLFVIDREAIRRSGATSIPELLRMVPGVLVRRIEANKWAISSRGCSRPITSWSSVKPSIVGS